MGFPEGQLCVLLTDDDEVRFLNRSYRGEDKETDVLAFAAQEAENAHLFPDVLGDVVISVEQAQRQAEEVAHERKVRLWDGGDDGAKHNLPGEEEPWTVGDEITFLMIHGILHLVGYDHADVEEEKRMKSRERELVKVCRTPAPRGCCNTA